MIKYIQLFFITSIIISCGQQPDYAVLIFSPNDWSETEVYVVTGEKSVDGIFFLELESSGGQKLWVEAWRVERAKSRAAAEELASRPTQRYQTLSQGARLWSKPESSSPMVSHLGKNMEVRLLGEVPNDGRSSVRWVEVVSRNGFRGYIPRYMLGNLAQSDEVLTLAGLLEKSPWRPADFEEMIQSGRISIHLLSQDMGLKISPEEGILNFSTLSPARDIIQESIKFSAISEIADSQREFLIQGPVQARLKWLSPKQLRLFITRSTQEETFDFISFQGEAQDRLVAAISAERAKREEYLRTLVSVSTRWQSEAYGSLVISDQAQYEWGGMDRLIPYLKIELESEMERLSLSVGDNFNEQTEGTGVEPDTSRLKPYLKWLGAVTHGGYQVLDVTSYEWRGQMAFDFYAPLPPQTLPLVPNSGFPMGLFLYLDEGDAAPLPFAVGLDKEQEVVKGLVLIPIPNMELQGEGQFIETLPRNPIILYFRPVY